MKFAVALAVAAAGLVSAQNVESPPFHLVLSSPGTKWDGKGVSACHTGAAIESLCIGDSGLAFHHNTTEGSQPAMEGYSAGGILTYNVPAQPPIPSSMRFSTDPASNVALLLFMPGYQSQYIAFNDATGEMSVISYIDDTISPPAYKTRALNRWYVCRNNYSGYQYDNLNWVYGTNEPQNPSCVSVTVSRVMDQ